MGLSSVQPRSRMIRLAANIALLVLGLIASFAVVCPLIAQTESIRDPFEFLPVEDRAVEDRAVEVGATDVAIAAEVELAELQITEVPNSGVPVAEPAPADEKVVEIRAVDELGPADQVLKKTFQRALVIEVDGPIFDRFHWYLNNRLDLAQQQQVDLIVLRLTSPGGDLEHSLQLARRLRDIDWATTVAYIPEEAISGGAIIALGCDRIYMQPGALLGDAGPIRMGIGGQFEHAEEKIVSYTASAVRELASGKGRPPALAEAMVDRSLTVFHATNMATGKKTFLSEKEFNAEGIGAKFELGEPVPETGKNRFLTLGADRAQELQLCEGLFASEADLLQQLSTTALERTRINWVDKTVFTLNRPWLTALLLIAGLIGLYLELVAPGISIAGLSSLFCFGIFFWSHFLGGTAGWLEVLLFFMGIVCLGFELFVLPGFGVFGLSGLALVVISLVMASQNFIVPRDAAEWGEMRVNLLVVLGSVLGVLVLFFAQILLLDSIPGLNRFRLSAPEGQVVDDGTPHTTGLLQSSQATVAAPPAVGTEGIAESDLRPSGKVIIRERLLDVITEGDYVEAGSQVEVLRVEGNRIVVRRV